VQTRQRIGEDIYIEDRYLTIKRIYIAAVDRCTKTSTPDESLRISGLCRMASAAATDRMTNERPMVAHTQHAERTRTAGALSRPHPSTLYYTRNTTFGTAYNNALTSSPSSDQTTQISWTKFLMQRRRYQGRSHTFAGTIRPVTASPCFERMDGTREPPTDNAVHGSCISIVFLVLYFVQPLIISLPTTPSQISSNHTLRSTNPQITLNMQFTTAILALAASASVALAQVNPALCAGRVAQCCQLDVLDLAAVSCENR